MASYGGNFMIVNNVALEIEGMDRAGKDTLAEYIKYLGNYAYTINVRGILTQIVYNDKFDRNNVYALPYKPFIVFLDVNNTDHAIRCKTTDEAKINVDKDREAFYEYINELRKYGITVLTYNTSETTMINIAKDVIKHLEKVDIKDFILPEPIMLSSLNVYTKEDLKGEDVFYKFTAEEN